MNVADRVAGIVGPLVGARGCTLYDIEHRGGVVAVQVDRPGGIDLETITELTRAISRALDTDDPIAGRYTLEVSSPGLERNLRTPAHFAAAVGETVSVRLRARPDDDTAPRRIRGVLTAADDEGVDLLGDDGGASRLAFTEIDRARTVFEWGPAPRPDKKRPDMKRANA